jgi:hypothetical protein
VLLLVDRAEAARSGQAGDCAVVVADVLDLNKVVHRRTIWMACRKVRCGGQHRTIERAQGEMWHKPAQLDEYVEIGQVEVSPESASAGRDSIRLLDVASVADRKSKGCGELRLGLRTVRQGRPVWVRLQPWRPRQPLLHALGGTASHYFSLARRCLAGGPNSSMNCTPSPRAIFSIIIIVGFARLFSIRLIAACSTFVTAASSS